MIIILGMHRSGTSAITELVASMGAYVGTPAECLPATADNPRGFFERRDVLAINRALLKSQNCNWYSIEGFDSSRPAPGEISGAMEACTQHLATHAPYIIKDPRFCLTLPYWRHFISPHRGETERGAFTAQSPTPEQGCPHPNPPPTGEGIAIILVIRHPATIANSLQLRNNMPLEQGLILWENYMTHALRNIEGMPVIRCHYEAFLQQPKEQTQTLHAQLTTYFPTLKLPETLPFTPSLSRASNQGITLSDAQQRLYDQLAG